MNTPESPAPQPAAAQSAGTDAPTPRTTFTVTMRPNGKEVEEAWNKYHSLFQSQLTALQGENDALRSQLAPHPGPSGPDRREPHAAGGQRSQRESIRHVLQEMLTTPFGVSHTADRILALFPAPVGDAGAEDSARWKLVEPMIRRMDEVFTLANTNGDLIELADIAIEHRDEIIEAALTAPPLQPAQPIPCQTAEESRVEAARSDNESALAMQLRESRSEVERLKVLAEERWQQIVKDVEANSKDLADTRRFQGNLIRLTHENNDLRAQLATLREDMRSSQASLAANNPAIKS